MIKILHWILNENYVTFQKKVLAGEELTEEEQEFDKDFTTYDLSVDDTSVTIAFKVKYNNRVRECTATVDISEKESAYDVFIEEGDTFKGQVYPIWQTACDARNGYGTNGPDREKMARVIVDDLGDVYILFTYACLDIDGYENILMDGTKPASGYLKEACPWFSAMHTKARRKINFSRYIDTNKSISYLEAQVDVLTKIVLKLCGGKEIDYVDLLEKADAQSVFNIKPLKDIEAEFTESKQNMRKLQEGYYVKLQE